MSQSDIRRLEKIIARTRRVIGEDLRVDRLDLPEFAWTEFGPRVAFHPVRTAWFERL